VQVLVPLHHQLLCRDAAWTLDGFNFAWNVMLVEKAGSVRFSAEDRASGERRTIEPRAYLSAAQERAMAQDPEMIRSLACHIAEDVRARTGRSVAVRAEAFATLNARPAQRLIDPRVDLTQHALPAGWVLPLRTGSAAEHDAL
jgi:hypothetical protein